MKRGRCETSGEGESGRFSRIMGAVDFVRVKMRADRTPKEHQRDVRARAITFCVIR